MNLSPKSPSQVWSGRQPVSVLKAVYRGLSQLGQGPWEQWSICQPTQPLSAVSAARSQAFAFILLYDAALHQPLVHSRSFVPPPQARVDYLTPPCCSERLVLPSDKHGLLTTSHGACPRDCNIPTCHCSTAHALNVAPLHASVVDSTDAVSSPQGPAGGALGWARVGWVRWPRGLPTCAFPAVVSRTWSLHTVWQRSLPSTSLFWTLL